MSQIQAVAGDTGAGATSKAITITSSTAGSTLLAFAVQNGDAVTSVTDNLGQGWSAASINLTSKSSCWYKTNSAAGVVTVTFNFSFSAKVGCVVVERDDIYLASPYDVDIGNNEAAAAGTWSSGATLTTTQANDIAYSIVCSTSGANRALAPSGSWVAVSGTGLTAGRFPNTTDGDDYFIADQILSTTQTVTSTGTCTNPSQVYSAAIALKLISTFNVAWITA
jgi:hypothetical protein